MKDRLYERRSLDFEIKDGPTPFPQIFCQTKFCLHFHGTCVVWICFPRWGRFANSILFFDWSFIFPTVLSRVLFSAQFILLWATSCETEGRHQPSGKRNDFCFWVDELRKPLKEICHHEQIARGLESWGNIIQLMWPDWCFWEVYWFRKGTQSFATLWAWRNQKSCCFFLDHF